MDTPKSQIVARGKVMKIIKKNPTGSCGMPHFQTNTSPDSPWSVPTLTAGWMKDELVHFSMSH